MNKKIVIGLIVVILLAGGFFLVRYLTKGSMGEGIDESLINEEGKTGSTELDSSKTLVIYFSQSGNTQKLAKLISDKVGGDFIRIETVKVYPTTYAVLADEAKKERDKDERPALIELNLDLSKYDTIFVGYPIWWYTLPMPMYTFFDKYDFSGKTIVPFNTHEGSGNSGTYETIKKFEPNATVLEGLPIRGGDMTSDQSLKVNNWLKELDFIK